MFWKRDYKEYPMLINGNHFDGFQYAINIYSGDRELLMLLDSGATLCQIGNTVLKGCQYYNTKQSQNTVGIGGVVKQRRILLEFDLFRRDDPNADYQFGLDTMVLNKKDNLYFNNGNLDGILGTNFLSFCEMDCRRGAIRVYKDLLF